jgi:hypothetical protein
VLAVDVRFAMYVRSRPLMMIFRWAVCSVLPVAIPLSGQNAPSAQSRGSSQPATQISATPPPAAKKIWTNDDLSGAYEDGRISSTGSHSATTRLTQATAQSLKQSAASYRDQIAKLQAKIPPLDAQIAELQAAIDGKPTGDARKSVRPYSVRADSWAAELDQRNKKRDDIADKISQLRDEARRNGIPANALP